MLYIVLKSQCLYWTTVLHCVLRLHTCNRTNFDTFFLATRQRDFNT